MPPSFHEPEPRKHNEWLKPENIISMLVLAVAILGLIIGIIAQHTVSQDSSETRKIQEQLNALTGQANNLTNQSIGLSNQSIALSQQSINLENMRSNFTTTVVAFPVLAYTYGGTYHNGSYERVTANGWLNITVFVVTPHYGNVTVYNVTFSPTDSYGNNITAENRPANVVFNMDVIDIKEPNMKVRKLGFINGLNML